MEKIKVLIADDHAVMQDGIKALLSSFEDIEMVGVASDGKEAITQSQELEPDVIIMDISMPIIDGIEATRQIIKKNHKVKILVLSQHENQEYVLAAIKAGASGYLPKKAMGSEVVSAIRAVYCGGSFLHPTAAATLVEKYRQTAEVEPYDRLSQKEREVLKLVAEGHTSREIAEILFISLKTVQGHRSHIMEKLDIHNRTELVKYAMRKGLITIESEYLLKRSHQFDSQEL